MGAFVSFTFVAGLLLMAGYFVYKLAFAGSNKPLLSRWVLLALYPCAFLLPWIVDNVSFGHRVNGEVTVSGGSAVMIDAAPVENVVSWQQVVLWIYIVGASVAAVFTLWSLVRLWWLLHRADTEAHDDYTLAILNVVSYSPFSWMNYVAIGRNDLVEGKNFIIAHELAHVKAMHWVDMLLGQLVAIVLWYNPAAWLLLDELRTVHEYQADEAVLNSGINDREYQLFIIKKAVGRRIAVLANSLNHSNLKKRITMMCNRRKVKSRPLRALALVPAFALALSVSHLPVMASALNSVSVATTMVETASKDSKKPVKRQVATHRGEKLPQFKGGEVAMMKYLSENVRYPEEAVKQGVQGTVIVRFTVMSDGSVANAEIVKSPSELLNAESLRVVNSMPAWNPGTKDGKPVECQYTLPIKFKMSSPTSAKRAPVKEAIVDDNTVASSDVEIPQTMAQFKGGEAAMMQYLAENVRYPEEAKKKEVQGRVIVRFTIEPDGRITEAHIMRSIDESLDAEALRVVNSMPSWNPGTKDGKSVRCSYVLPITFKLPK